MLELCVISVIQQIQVNHSIIMDVVFNFDVHVLMNVQQTLRLAVFASF